jgi:NTP-dependent ternary system trypsin peptidase co-occuring protein
VTERARCTFEDAVQRVEPAAQAIITRLRGMAQAPDEVQIEFGLDLHAEAGAFIAAAAAAANFKIPMTWRHTQPSSAQA